MDQTRTPWRRFVLLPIAAGLIALVAAVSSWAAGTPASTESAASGTAQYQTVQDAQATPDADGDADGDGHGHGGPGGGGKDCPEEDGQGDGAGSGASESQSQPAPTTPAAPTATPDV
jgi:hypothetical protein